MIIKLSEYELGAKIFILSFSNTISLFSVDSVFAGHSTKLSNGKQMNTRRTYAKESKRNQ